MYYPCSENKGADQLRGYREADLRLCFCLCKLLVFSCTGSNAVKLCSEDWFFRIVDIREENTINTHLADFEYEQ